MPKIEKKAAVFVIKFFLNDIVQIYDKKLVKLYRYCGTHIYLEFIRFFRESASFLSLKHTFGPHELSSKIPRTYLLKCHALTLKCIYPQHSPMAWLTRRIHQIFSRISISESTNFLTNICYDLFFNKQTETIRNLAPFSTAKTEKNSWKKLVKASDEFVVI